MPFSAKRRVYGAEMASVSSHNALKKSAKSVHNLKMHLKMHNRCDIV